MTITTGTAVHLHARPTGILSAERIVEDIRSGQRLTRIVPHWSGWTGRFTVDGQAYEILRTSLFAPAYELTTQHRVIATARRPAVFSRQLEVVAGGRTWTIVRPLFHRDLDIRHAGNTVGSIARTNWLSRDLELVASEEMPAEIAVFFLWLAHAMRRRSHAH